MNCICTGEREAIVGRGELPGGKNLVVGILDVDDIDGARVLLDVGDDSNSSDVVSADGVGSVAELELDEVLDLVVDDVQLDRISDVDVRAARRKGKISKRASSTGSEGEKQT